jgi:hypothetical protein
MHKRRLLSLLILLSSVLAACAVGDIPATPPPPLTIEPPPTLVYEGACEQTSTLEVWLQKTTFAKNDFVNLMDAAASQGRAEMVDEVIGMIDRRLAVSRTTVPDCATEPHLILLDAMNKAIEAFQKFVNGDAENIGNIVGDTKKRFETLDIYMLELTDRLDLQYQQLLTTTP